jgi:hypothetical protein
MAKQKDRSKAVSLYPDRAAADYDGDRLSRSQGRDLGRNDEFIRDSLVGKRGQQRHELTA